MRNWILAAAAILVATSGCNAAREEKVGPSVDRRYQVGSFDRIDVAGPYAVNMTTGASPSVRASGPVAYLEKMTIVVDGRTLRIRQQEARGFNFLRRQGKEVTLQVAVPSIRRAEIAGPAGLAIDRISGKLFEGVVAGSGDLKLDSVQVDSISVEIAGSGGAVAAGKAGRAEYVNGGSGDIDAARVATTDASVLINGSGNVSAQASRTADVDVQGSGYARIGGGARCIVSKAGPGNVSCG